MGLRGNTHSKGACGVRKKASRVQQIADLIMERGSVRAQELAEVFMTSRRTIYRDIERLKKQGFHVEAFPGSQGGFRRTVRPLSAAQEFTVEEACAILVAASLARDNQTLPSAQALDDAIDKIWNSLSPTAREEMEETLPNVSCAQERIVDPDYCSEYLDVLAKAIAHQRVVSMTYYSLYRDSEELREIDPYHLYGHKGVWYVIALCHHRQQMRVFRLDRIKELTMLERLFERPTSFNLNNYLGHAWSMIKGETHRVAVRFMPPHSRFIAESKWHPSQKIEQGADGSITFTAEVEGLEEFARWVLAYGEHAEVLHPSALRDSMRESATKMLSYYQQ